MSQAGRRSALALLAVLLAWIGGFVDGVGYLLLQKVFVAHQSGNTVASTVGVAQGDWSLVIRRGPPIALFVLGVAIGAAVLEFASRRRVSRLTSVTLSIEAVLLVGCMVAGAFVVRHGKFPTKHIWQYTGLLTLLVLAMGLQTATLRKIGRRTVRTTYISGMLTHIAEEAVGYLVDRHDACSDPSRLQSMQYRSRRFRLLVGIWSTYAAGGIAGAFAEIGWATYALAVPVAILVVVVAVDRRWPWHAPNEDPLHDEVASAA